MLSHAQLSPSGKHVALTRRVGEVDEVLDVDLSSSELKTTVLFRTKLEKPDAIEQGARQRVTYLAWKGDDHLLISYNVGFRIAESSIVYAVPVHVLLDAHGKAAPQSLTLKQSGNQQTFELSEILSDLPNDPNHFLLSIPAARSLMVDRVDVRDGSRQRVEIGDNIGSYGVNPQGVIVTRTVQSYPGFSTFQARAPGATKWTTVLESNWGRSELNRYRIYGGLGEKTLYVGYGQADRGDEPRRTVRPLDLATLKLGDPIWSNAKYDISSIVQDDKTGEVIGACYIADVRQCEFRSRVLEANSRGLSKAIGPQRSFEIISKSDDQQTWLLEVSGPDDPGSYFTYDMKEHRIENLGPRWPELQPEQMGAMRRLDFKARDGAELSAYVTEPPGGAGGPLVVMPHGGPESRDRFAFDEWAQFLATRGYTVLQPNFRGSGGFGSDFAKAGWGQWGLRMHDDVMDAMRALLAEGKLDARRVCIVGASYGGYEALYAGATEPDAFRCAVSVDGVSDLPGALKHERSVNGVGPPRDALRYWLQAIGNPDTDGEKLAAHSPYRMAASWRTPLLLIHGEKDTNVPADESRQMAHALTSAGKPVRYIEIHNMGHGPASEKEKIQVLRELESFLGQHLNGAATSPVATR